MPGIAIVITAKEVATLLGVTERTACKLMQDGQLSAFRLGGKVWRTTRPLLDEYVRQACQDQLSDIAPRVRVNDQRIAAVEQRIRAVEQALSRLT